jgi:hypothetical protein
MAPFRGNYERQTSLAITFFVIFRQENASAGDIQREICGSGTIQPGKNAPGIFAYFWWDFN